MSCANTSHGGDCQSGRGTVRVVTKLRNLVCPTCSFVTNMLKVIVHNIEAKIAVYVYSSKLLFMDISKVISPLESFSYVKFLTPLKMYPITKIILLSAPCLSVIFATIVQLYNIYNCPQLPTLLKEVLMPV